MHDVQMSGVEEDKGTTIAAGPDVESIQESNYQLLRRMVGGQVATHGVWQYCVCVRVCVCT